jgi:hypothetical protein
MSKIRIGDEATFRGRRVTITGRAPHLAERQWKVRWWRYDPETGELLGQESEIAPESGLSAVRSPEFKVGDKVRVGFPPLHQRGVISRKLVAGDRVQFEVSLPPELRKSPQTGTGWIRDETRILVGPEVLRLRPE